MFWLQHCEVAADSTTFPDGYENTAIADHYVEEVMPAPVMQEFTEGLYRIEESVLRGAGLFPMTAWAYGILQEDYDAFDAY